MTNKLTSDMDAGKYGDLCTLVRKRAKATAVLLIVVNGNKGSGFSAQGDLVTLLSTPDVLEEVARQMRGSTLAERPQ